MANTKTALTVALARKRIESNVRRLVVATRKTLESKVCENGRQRVSPLILTPVIRDMITGGELVTHPFRLGELLSLPGTAEDELKRRAEATQHALTVFHKFASGARNSEGIIGKAGEDMIERALRASSTMHPMNWGEAASRQFRGVTLEQPSDGLIAIRSTIEGRDFYDHVALVEVKNRRDWTTADNFMPWKLIRNAYKYDVVGIYFSRRIMRTAFWFTFKRIGAIGVETFNQFAPPDIETDVASARHKHGLGYHDLYFKNDVPKHLQKQIDALPPRIIAARDRMNEVRYIVEEYVDLLADQSITDGRRKAVFKEFKNRIIEHDAQHEAEDASDPGSDYQDGAYDRYVDDQIDAAWEDQRSE